ncbi:MAG TPA: ABC transporter permease [Chryseosolibacter sp.]
MLQSLVILAFRKFIKNLSYSIIAVGGLVIGLTTAILVFLWGRYELTYDRYHPDNERVYAVMINERIEGAIETYDETPVPLMEKLSFEVPEVEAVTRFDNTRAQLSFNNISVLKYGAYADTSYFDVFNPSIVAGDVHNPLSDNQSIAISQSLSRLLFGSESAIGKVVLVGVKQDYKVTAIFSDFPDNSSLSHYSFILPFNSRVRSEDEWQNYFVKLTSSAVEHNAERKIDAALHAFMGDRNSSSLLFPLTDWRLHWNFENGKIAGGRIVYVVTFLLTAVFILIMACVNYVNLSTASAAQRAREIGVRKMTGATQRILAQQFLLESFVLTLMAMALAMLLAYLVLPHFNQMTGIPLEFTVVDPFFLAGMGCILLFTTVVAGGYPAFLLSRIKPVLVLKGNLTSSLTGGQIRKMLVVFQFTLSVILIFAAIVLRKQTDFLLTKELGYDKTNVINIWMPQDANLWFHAFKSEVERHSDVVSAGYGGASPMEVNGSAEVTWDGKPNDEPMFLNGVSADHSMLDALKFTFVQGRNFSPDRPSDSSAFVITHSAARKLGFTDPVGQTITYKMFGEQQGQIIGVINDFQNEDIHAPMDPVIFVMTSPKYLTNLFVRYRGDNLEKLLAHIKTVHNKFKPGESLDISFLDSDFENQFFRERFLGNISVWFTGIAVAIAGLGLLGLTMFDTQRRTKEIGVRKVLGAKVSQIVVMLCRDFLKPVLISFLLAFPLAYVLMDQFLEGYAFRITLSAVLFLSVGVLMTVFVLLTVSVQSIKAARANPVRSLKNNE